MQMYNTFCCFPYIRSRGVGSHALCKNTYVSTVETLYTHTFELYKNIFYVSTGKVRHSKLHTFTCVDISTSIHSFMCLYSYVHIHIYIYTYKYLYIYIDLCVRAHRHKSLIGIDRCGKPNQLSTIPK